MDPRNTGLDVSSSHLGGELPTRTAAAVKAGNLAARLSKVAGGDAFVDSSPDRTAEMILIRVRPRRWLSRG